MSAGVSDQRMKGQGNQVNNGPKEQLGEGGVAAGSVSEDFESWRSQQQQAQQQQQAGGAAHTPYAASVPISSATDPYNMSTAAGYYGSGGTFPYQAFGVGDGTWSNGTDPMTFLGGYTHDSYSMDGMFGPSTTFSTTAFGQPSAFNYFPGNGDYSTWGTQLNQRKPHYDDYYRTDTQNMYATPQTMQDTNLTLKSVEQNMQNLSIDMNTSSNLHMNSQLSHNLGPQLAKGDGKDMKGSSSDGVKEGSIGVQPKKMTWASIASQPAKPQVTLQSSGLKKKGPGMPPGPIVPGKHNMDIGTWDTNKSTPPQIPVVNSVPPPPKVTVNVNVRPAWPGPVRAQAGQSQTQQIAARPPQQQQQPPPPQQQQQQQQQQHIAPVQQQQQPPLQQQPPPPVSAVQQHYMPAGVTPHPVGVPHMPPPPGPGGMPPPTPQQLMMPPAVPTPSHPVLDELRVKNNYNPTDFDLNAPGARFFVIKSYSEDDIHRSIKYEIWCSTEHGNKRLDQAFREREKEPNGCVYLFFSVNGSGHFCGMAQMMSPVDYHSNSSVWSQDKWRGQFRVHWIYVKDVPNHQLRHIKLENNENKPVTNSRDTQEVPHARGLQVLRIIHSYRHSTSIFDDFIHYEKRQEEEDSRKIPEPRDNHRDNHHGGSNRENHHGGSGGGRDNHHGGGGRDNSGRDNHHSSGGGRGDGHHSRDNRGGDGGRDHRDRRNQDRDSMHDNHRPGNQRNHDGPHHKERGDNNSRGRGRGGRNIN